MLTQQADYQTARKYWNQLKHRMDREGRQSVTNCHRLKLPAADGKRYLTDVATAETLLRIVQTIPSPKAEPIKLWLAKVGYERMQELADPALSLNRAHDTWQQHGRSDKWIQQRMTGQETRNKLTDDWREHGVQPGQEFAILTNLIHQAWSGLSVQQHKAAAAVGGRIAKQARQQLEQQTGRSVVTGDNYLPSPQGLKMPEKMIAQKP